MTSDTAGLGHHHPRKDWSKVSYGRRPMRRHQGVVGGMGDAASANCQSRGLSQSSIQPGQGQEMTGLPSAAQEEPVHFNEALMQADSPTVGQRLDWQLLPKTKGHDRDTAVWSPCPSCPSVPSNSSGWASGQGSHPCQIRLLLKRSPTRHPRARILDVER